MTEPEEIQKGKLSPAQQKVLKHLQPRSTLPGIEKEKEEPIPRPMSTSTVLEPLLQAAYNHWSDVETSEELSELLHESYPGATQDQIQQAVKKAGEKRTEEETLKYQVTVSTWTDPSGAEVTLTYRNDPKLGIYAHTWTVKAGASPKEKTDFISDYFIRDVVKHTNPLDPADVTYSLTLQNSKREHLKIPYEETRLADITGDVAHNQPGVRDSRGRVHAAISSLIGHLETEGKVSIKASIPATGFFEEASGRLYHSDYRGVRLTPYEYSRVKTVKSLEVLGKILEFYTTDGDCDRALITIYFIVSGPLGSIRKANGKENKILLLAGTPHTGKTILERINTYIWGLPEAASVIGAAKLTAPQLATHISLTTYPISFDEVRTALSNPTIADLLKSSTTGLLVKERILAKQGFRKQQFYAYASVIMSTNYLPELYTGMRERLIPIEFTIRNKKTEEQAKEFDRYLSANKESLGYLGAAIRRLFTRNWSRVKGLALQDDQVKAGFEILYTLCQQEGIEPPAWLHEVETRFELEEPDPVRIVCKFLAEDVLRQLRAHEKQDYIPLEWDKRLNLLREKNILPPYVVNISDRAISITNEIFRELEKKGYEIPTGLTGLAAYVNQHPKQTKKIGRIVGYGSRGPKYLPIMREVFYEYAQAADYQEELNYPQDQHD